MPSLMKIPSSVYGGGEGVVSPKLSQSVELEENRQKHEQRAEDQKIAEERQTRTVTRQGQRETEARVFLRPYEVP